MLGESADRPRRWHGDSLAALEGTAEQQCQGIDYVDQLPNSILLVIFNRIGDVKSLGRCCAVSRRFHSLVRLVDDISVRIDCVISDSLSVSSSSAAAAEKSRSILSHLARLVLGGIFRPFHALGQVLYPSSSSKRSSASSQVSHHSPVEVLKNFREIRRLRMELPAGELGVKNGVFLKWKADFGSTIDNCVILGASSIVSSSSSLSAKLTSSCPADELCAGEDGRSIPESFYANGGLKLRLLWTISSLIAASARHYLLQPIISDHETLDFLYLTDSDSQGVLTMNRRQLQEVRARPASASGSSQRTLIPALNMRLWYAPVLEIPGGMLLKGATLVSVQPSEEKSRSKVAGGGCGTGGPSDLPSVLNAFEEPYRTAARMLTKGKSYCLEMNSF